MLMDTATQEQGTGTPVKLIVNHKVLQNHNFLSPDPCTLFPPKLTDNVYLFIRTY